MFLSLNFALFTIFEYFIQNTSIKNKRVLFILIYLKLFRSKCILDKDYRK